MTHKVCKDWNSEEFIEATCPYCGDSDRHYGPWIEGDVVGCNNKKCKKKFKLGEEG